MTYTGIRLHLISEKDRYIELLGDPLEPRKKLVEFLERD